tara:strand:+ start:194 stop:430 length:237 start_codon:yes stop_codon:yes gene_type:complete
VVSVREIRRVFKSAGIARQLPDDALEAFQDRAEKLLVLFAQRCDEKAGDSNSRLTKEQVALAFLQVTEDEEEFGDWNE